MLEVFQLTQPSEYFNRTLFSGLKSLHHILHTICACWTHLLTTNVSMGPGSQAQLWDLHAGEKNNKSAGQHLLTHAQKASMTRVSQCFEKLVPGCPWWSPEHRAAAARDRRKLRYCVHMVSSHYHPEAQGTSPHEGLKGHQANHALWGYGMISNIKNSPNRDHSYPSKTSGVWLTACTRRFYPNHRLRFPQETGFAYCLSPGCQTTRFIQHKGRVATWLINQPLLRFYFSFKQPCRNKPQKDSVAKGCYYTHKPTRMTGPHMVTHHWHANPAGSLKGMNPH